MTKRVVGWFLIALSLLVLASTLSLYMRGGGSTFPDLPASKFSAYLIGRIAGIVLPFAAGLYLLRKQNTAPETLPPIKGKRGRTNDIAKQVKTPDSTERPIVERDHKTVVPEIDDDDRWESAAAYFPEIMIWYERLCQIDTSRGQSFRAQILAKKEFKQAEERYWQEINAIAFETCGPNNKASRDFLLSTINNSDFSTVRNFIALSKDLGAENMNKQVLEKFKASGREYKKNTTADASRWRNIVKHAPQIDFLHKALQATSSDQASSFKASILSQRDNSGVQQVFSDAMQTLLNDHCRGKNWQPRTFLMETITAGNLDVARRFMKLAKSVGPENVDNSLLDKFRSKQ